MISLTPNGIRYQTRALPTAKAWRFAVALKANRRFANVELHHLGDGTRRYRVSYRPASRRREAQLLADQQVARIERADSCDPDKYGATPYECSCPDRTFRGRANGLACKHMVAAARAEANRQPEPAPEADPTVDERRAETERQLAQLRTLMGAA